jgi:hypothetical protein
MDTATDTIHRAIDILSNLKGRSRGALRLRVLTLVVEGVHDPIFSPDAAHQAPNSHRLPGILLAYGELIAAAVQHRVPGGVDYPKMDIELRADRRRAKIAKEFCASGSPRVCDNVLRH